jgi:DNA sulfur modification protein DndE
MKTTAPLQFTLQRIPFCQSVDSKMRTLKGRTGITPNILARMGFALSIEEPGLPPDPFAFEEVGREINRNTLLGQHDEAFVALLRTWFHQRTSIDLIDNDVQKTFDQFMVAHMNRGCELLSARMRNLAGLRAVVASV